jgi:hypothetical protein
MTRTKSEPQRPEPPLADASVLSAGAVVAGVGGLAAAWVAAGSVGLLATPLRHALVWVLFLAAVAACWPWNHGRSRWVMAVSVAAAVVLLAFPLPAVNVLAVAVLLAGLSLGRSGADGRTMLVTAQAVAAFGLYRMAVTGVSVLWLAADALGGGLGAVAGRMAGQPLSVGASFGGVDFLVLMAAMGGLWVAMTPGPRWRRGIAVAVGVSAGHLAYLLVLAHASQISAAVHGWAASGVNTEPLPPGAPTPWSFWAGVETLLPWNLPALAGLAQLAVACAMLRWSPPPAAQEEGARNRRLGFALAASACVAAIVLPLATVLYGPPEGLKGKKIVVNEKGFLNWLRPRHGEYGRLSVGMYGMLPEFVESLGATLVKTPDYSAKDLDGAAALILLYPNQAWEEGQLDRIHEFVRKGGSLLVMGEHTNREEDGGSRFNEVLAPTTMRVQFDCAQWAVGGWLNCYEPLAHPITAGNRDERNDFGIVIGASLEARWPARPLILGRWGWSDWGDEGSSRAMMGNDRYDAGERLGDVCLAAEQRLGQGKVIAFGDTSSLTNGINISSHVFTSALLGYLTEPRSARPLWRDVLGLLAAVLAAALVWLRASPWRTAVAAAAAGVALLLCADATHRANLAVPDGGVRQPNDLAYIDTAHLGAFSQEALRDDGLMGLEYTLMRSGFLTLSLSEFCAEALDRAALLVTVAPARPYSADERQAVRDFVARGGVFVCTVGYDGSAAAAPLLRDFGLRVGVPGRPDAAPEPLGHFKSPYVNIKGRMHYVRFHAAWPVADDVAVPGPASGLVPAQAMAYGAGDVPVILMRPWGKGKVVLVGDTGFAWNVNLEHVDGSPFEGLRENADFWRWFLGYVADREPWTPPGPEAAPAAAPAKAPAAPEPARKGAPGTALRPPAPAPPGKTAPPPAADTAPRSREAQP